jgi:hypothetical protein
MTNDDIAHKLALLPEGLSEANLQTWQETIDYYQKAIQINPEIQIDPEMNSSKIISGYKHLLDLVLAISKTGQEKLFRIDSSLWMIKISTQTSERVGERQGFPFIVIDLKSDVLSIVGYYDPTTSWKITECMNDEIMPALQPLLDKLWNETRGKKNA